MEFDISLDFLLKTLKKNWWRIVIFALVVMIAVGCFTHFLINKKYSSSAKFYVVNVNSSVDYTTASYLSAAEYLINDYVSIIKSDYLLNMVCDNLKEKYEWVTPAQIRPLIQHTANTNTSTFVLSVTHTDKFFAYDVTKAITEIAPDAITSLTKPDSKTNETLANNIYKVIQYYNTHPEAMNEPGKLSVTENEIQRLLEVNELGLSGQLTCMETITEPKVAITHDSPNLITYTAIGGIAAAVLAYLVFLLLGIVKMNVTTEDDVKKLLNRPLLGTIPRWEVNSEKK